MFVAENTTQQHKTPPMEEWRGVQREAAPATDGSLGLPPLAPVESASQASWWEEPTPKPEPAPKPRRPSASAAGSQATNTAPARDDWPAAHAWLTAAVRARPATATALDAYLLERERHCDTTTDDIFQEKIASKKEKDV